MYVPKPHFAPLLIRLFVLMPNKNKCTCFVHFLLHLAVITSDILKCSTH